jgi:tetratricopeptide (TPR) repeat protein
MRNLVGLVMLVCLLRCAHPHTLNARAVALQTEGAASLERGELDRAAGQFALALDYEPRYAEAENGLGLVAMRHEDWDAAEEHFAAALGLDENLAEAHLNLGGVLLRRNRTEEAVEHFLAALAIDPGYGEARLAAGEGLLRLGRASEARWELAKACAAEPDRAEAHAAYALALSALGRSALAEAEARAALTLDATLPMTHRARADILRRSGDFEGAAAELHVAIGKGPGEIDDRLALVTVLAARGQWHQAEREAAGVVLAAPRRAEAHFLVAYVALGQEHLTEAVAAAGTALALRRQYPEARLVRAEALARQGRLDEARRDLEQFLAEAPPELSAERARAEAFLRRPVSR